MGTFDKGNLVVDVTELARQGDGIQALWAGQSTDLNVNLLRWSAGETVAEHINTEVDVLIVCLAGRGNISIDGTDHSLEAGQALLIPKGSRRAIQSASERFAYLSCHRRRSGLWPTRRHAVIPAHEQTTP